MKVKVDIGSVLFMMPLRIVAESRRAVGVEWTYVPFMGEARSFLLHLFANQENLPHGLKAYKDRGGSPHPESDSITRDEVRWWVDEKGVELAHCPVGGPKCTSLYHMGPKLVEQGEDECQDPECGVCHVCQGPHKTSAHKEGG